MRKAATHHTAAREQSAAAAEQVVVRRDAIVAAVSAWARRTLSIALYAVLCFVAVVGLPLIIVVALAADLLRGGNRAATARCATLAAAYLLCEIVGLIASAGVWIAYRAPAAYAAATRRLTGAAGQALRDRAERYLAVNYRLQSWWASTLYRIATRVFAMRITVAGDEAVQRGPFILFSRHVSMGDTLLPAVLVAARHGIRLRYVMKRELRWDPCLDVIGNRLPNWFVSRGSGESAREIVGMQRLVEQLGPRDAVLIYPEGTFFTEPARARALARLRQSGPAHLVGMATAMRSVLPPRLGGALGLLDRNPTVDAVFCAHTGFEGADTFRALLRGVLIGRTIRVRFWRVPFAEIPATPAARATWLYEQWMRVDAVVAEQGGSPST